MIISEKQIIQLMQIAQIHYNALNELSTIDKTLVTECGHRNKKNIASLLMKIAEQQSQELKEIK